MLIWATTRCNFVFLLWKLNNHITILWMIFGIVGIIMAEYGATKLIRVVIGTFCFTIAPFRHSNTVAMSATAELVLSTLKKTLTY